MNRLLLLALPILVSASVENWSHWLGPDGSGTSGSAAAPVR
jgi:hypothetical protein